MRLELTSSNQDFVTLKRRLEGEVTIIRSKDSALFPEIVIGNLIRSFGHDIKIAIVSNNSIFSKINTFFENLFISNKFKKNYSNLHFETFTYQGEEKIQRGILPNVEFQTIPSQKLLNILYKFEYVIFIDPPQILLNSSKFESYLKEKQEETEILILVDSLKNSSLKKISDNIYEVLVSENSSLTTKDELNLIINSPYSQLLSYGYLVRKFIEKKSVKIVSFEKGDNMYGENKFFLSLKQFSKEFNFYGDFDYLISGNSRLTNRNLRITNTNLDEKEISDSLMLAKSDLKKQTPVIIDNLDFALNLGLIDIDSFLNLVEGNINETLISFNFESENIEKLKNHSKNIIFFKELKISPTKLKNRKGLDF